MTLKVFKMGAALLGIAFMLSVFHAWDVQIHTDHAQGLRTGAAQIASVKSFTLTDIGYDYSFVESDNARVDKARIKLRFERSDDKQGYPYEHYIANGDPQWGRYEQMHLGQHFSFRVGERKNVNVDQCSNPYLYLR